MIDKNDSVVIFGGSGFLGQYVVKLLLQNGVRVRIVSRYADIIAKEVKVSGYVGQVSFVNYDLQNLDRIEEMIKGCNYVINLVGSFDSKNCNNLNALLPKKIGEVCAKLKVKKAVHISALGIEETAQKSLYAQTKLLGESSLIEEFDKATVLRPSAIFGIDDNFINTLAKIISFSPIIPLFGGGKTMLQPIYALDVANAIVKSLQMDGKSVVMEIAGPKQYSMRSLWEVVAKHSAKRRFMVSLPFAIGKLIAFFAEFLPNSLINREQIELLKHNNVIEQKNDLLSLGIKPTSIESILKKIFD